MYEQVLNRLVYIINVQFRVGMKIHSLRNIFCEQLRDHIRRILVC